MAQQNLKDLFLTHPVTLWVFGFGRFGRFQSQGCGTHPWHGTGIQLQIPAASDGIVIHPEGFYTCQVSHFRHFRNFSEVFFFVWRFLSQKPRFGEIHQNFLEPFLAWQLRRYLFISLSTTAGVAICFGTSVACLMALLHLLGKKPWYRGCCFDLDILREMATSCGTFSLCF